MSARLAILAALLCPLAASAAPPLVSGLVFESEVGPAAVVRGTQQWGDAATRLSASDLGLRDGLSSESRLSFEARLAEVHGVQLTWAPLSLSSVTALARDVREGGVQFPAGTPVEGDQRFDGYRLTYLYRFLDGKDLRWDLGAGVQLRNQRLELRSLDGRLYAHDATVGPVPLLATRLWWSAKPFWMSLEASGFTAGTGGGLYDAAFTFGLPLVTNGAISPFLRLRAYGGGEDVDRRSLAFATVSALLGIQIDAGGILRAIAGG